MPGHDKLNTEVNLQRVQFSDYLYPAVCSPNVDFYSGIVLRALGIPVSMYTVLFAVARTVGWVSQVRIPQPSQMEAHVSCKFTAVIVLYSLSHAANKTDRLLGTSTFGDACYVLQWKEMAEQQQVLPKISRPRQVSCGILGVI